MYNKIAKVLVVLMIVLVIIAFTNIIHFQLKGSNMEIGAWSDWVSAACNVVIAGTAIYAAVQAKEWFHKKKFELAHSLAREFILTLYKIDKATDTFSTHIKLFTASSSASTDIDKIKEQMDKLCVLLDTKELLLFELKRLKWEIKDDYTEINSMASTVDFEMTFHQVCISLIIYENDKEDSFQLEHDVNVLSVLVKEINDAIPAFIYENFSHEDYFNISK